MALDPTLGLELTTTSYQGKGHRVGYNIKSLFHHTMAIVCWCIVHVICNRPSGFFLIVRYNQLTQIRSYDEWVFRVTKILIVVSSVT